MYLFSGQPIIQCQTYGCKRGVPKLAVLIQGAHAYFRFYIYKAIRMFLFLPIFSERSYKDLIFGF